MIRLVRQLMAFTNGMPLTKGIMLSLDRTWWLWLPPLLGLICWCGR